MQEFWSFVANVQSVTSWLAKLAIAAPLLDIIVKIGPPWPSNASVGVITAVTEAGVLMWTFQFWKHIGKRRKELRMQYCGAVAVAAGVLYLMLFSFFTYIDPSEGRKLRGFVLQPSIAKLLNEQIDAPVPAPVDGGPARDARVPRSVEDVLEQIGYSAERVWKPWSVFVMRFTFIVVWMAMFIGIIGFIGAFVLLRPQDKASD